MGSGESFERFFEEFEPVVRRALVGRFGAELGREAAAEAFSVAWAQWERVAIMENPPGYVYRIAQRWAVRQVVRPAPVSGTDRIVEDTYRDHELAAALQRLSPRQSEAVILVKGLGLTYEAAARLLGCSRSSIQNHVERALVRLRDHLEVNENV